MNMRARNELQARKFAMQGEDVDSVMVDIGAHTCK